MKYSINMHNFQEGAPLCTGAVLNFTRRLTALTRALEQRAILDAGEASPAFDRRDNAFRILKGVHDVPLIAVRLNWIMKSKGKLPVLLDETGKSVDLVNSKNRIDVLKAILAWQDETIQKVDLAFWEAELEEALRKNPLF